VKRAALIGLIVGTALALVPVAFAATESDGGGAIAGASTQVTTTPLSQIDPAIRAVLVRNDSQTATLSGKALADFYDTGAVVTAEPAQNAGAFVGQTDTLGGNGTTTAATDSSSIDWSAFIPALLVGSLLLGTAYTVVTRRRHQLSV
jgi:hypothetical protein